MLELFLKRAARLTAGNRSNLSLVELIRRFGLSVVDAHQLKTYGVTNLSSLATSILAARELQRLAYLQPFPAVLRGKAALSSGTLPAPLVEIVARAIGEYLDASMQKYERGRQRPRHEHRAVKRPRRKKPGRR